MKELIERLEDATGPDRELDAEIARLVTGRGVTVAPLSGPRYDGDGEPVPAYTASLDAALTLMPRGAVLQNLTLRMQPEMGGKMYSAVVWHGSLFPSGGQRSFELAVACAALKAREGL